MAIVTGFAGYECEDIVLYLAKILSVLGKKVAIIDRTEQEMLLELLEVGRERNYEGEECEDEYEGIRIASRGVNKEEYDIVFLVFGYRLLHPKLYECENLVVVTDGVPVHASILRKIGQWDRKQCLIIRNMIAMKHGEKYLITLAGQAEEPCFSIPYDEQDMRMRYCLGPDSSFSIRRLSKEMKLVLTGLIRFIVPEYEEKNLMALMKKL